jgi:hypothetical protein
MLRARVHHGRRHHAGALSARTGTSCAAVPSAARRRTSPAGSGLRNCAQASCRVAVPVPVFYIDLFTQTLEQTGDERARRLRDAYRALRTRHNSEDLRILQGRVDDHDGYDDAELVVDVCSYPFSHQEKGQWQTPASGTLEHLLSMALNEGESFARRELIRLCQLTNRRTVHSTQGFSDTTHQFPR